MDEFDSLKIGRLQISASEGEQLRDLCRHAGFKILDKILKERIAEIEQDYKNAKTKDECWEAKLKLEPYHDFYKMIKGKILKGDAASHALQNMKDQDSADVIAEQP
jgi:hypothetical protein